MEVAWNSYFAVSSMIVTKEALELASEGLIVNLNTHYVLKKT
jgi:hypothetical protein